MAEKKGIKTNAYNVACTTSTDKIFFIVHNDVGLIELPVGQGKINRKYVPPATEYRGNKGFIKGLILARPYLEDVEVNGLDMRLSGNRTLPVRVPDNYIGVRADRYHSLSWIKVEDLCSVGAGHRHEPGRVHYSSVHPFLPNNRHPIFDTIHAIGDLGEIILA